MNKSRKSNTRGQGSNTNNRSSPRSRPPVAEGIYNNSHFLHAAAAQVGNNVRVKTKGGVIVEGIFRTFSENFHIALEVPHRYPNGSDDKKINVDTVQDNLIIKLQDIVTIEAKDVDLDYATRDTFQTDTAIASRLNGPVRHGEKQLEPWMDGLNGDTDVSLELDTKTNGWDANEMFQLNEKEHGIKTTYKDNLESYTVQIDRKDTLDFRKQEEEAQRIANEIENNPMTKERLEVENGDEEAAFAAVVRPGDEQNSTNSNMINNSNDKMTPPPSQKYIPKPQRNQTGGKMMPNNKMYTKPIQQQTSGLQPVQQTMNAGGFKVMTINPPPQTQFNQPPPTHYVSQNQQQQQQPPPPNQQQQQPPSNQQIHNNNADSGGNKMNGDSNSNNNSNKSMPPPTRNIRIVPLTFSEPPPPLNSVNANMGIPSNVGGIHIPPPHLQPVQAVPEQGIHVVQSTVLPPKAIVLAPHPIPIHAPPQPQPQRPREMNVMRSRNDEIRQLRQFQNEFQLVTPQQQQTGGPPQQNVPTPQVPSAPPQRPEMQDNGQNPMVHSGNVANDVGNNQQHPMGGNKQQHVNINHHAHHPTPSSTPHLDQKAGTPPQANTPQNVNSSVNNNSSNNSSSSGSSVSGVTNSNSNETTPTGSDKSGGLTKKFTLNPQAKPFTPRNPSTPNQSRPHTPQTPGPMAQQPPQQQIPQPQQQMVYAPPNVVYLVPSQQRPTPQQALARKTQFHQFQVTQATGQPIFNPPVPPQVMPYHPAPMQTVQSQSYPPAIRMYPHDGQPQPHLTSYLVPTPPSTTPSPGQPHQPTFHPGQQPSQATGPPTQAAFQPQGQYLMIMPSNAAPQFVYNQHNPQQFQIVSNALPQQQQHPAQ